jgi:hypothetical protein
MNMKTNYLPTCLAAWLLFTVAVPFAGRAQSSLPGGYSSAAVTNQEVTAAAAFAIQAQQAAMQEKKDAKPARLELVAIQQAEQQVVAGMNYRLRLKVKVNGQAQTAEAIVWWQAWRKPDPYRLTSWTWQ